MTDKSYTITVSVDEVHETMLEEIDAALKDEDSVSHNDVDGFIESQLTDDADQQIHQLIYEMRTQLVEE